MRGDFHVSAYVLFSVVLAIFILSFLVSFSSGMDTQSMPGYVAPKETVECSDDNPCSKGICMSINGQSNFCGCFEDPDCGGASSCLNNRCTP